MSAERLQEWLLNRLESGRYWDRQLNSTASLQSIAQLVDKASGDSELLQVATVFRGRQDFDLLTLVTELVMSASVPFLPKLLFSESGLRKRTLWEKMWCSQREEDDGGCNVQVDSPPEFDKKDFQSDASWYMRGKLDVPKERWISYPHCSTDSDPTLVVGWAGWNHLEQATALVAYYDARKREGWNAKRLTPLLAGLDQLLPWIHQWHPEIDIEYGETAGQSFQHMLESDAHELGLTRDDVREWTPPVKQTKASKKKAKG